MSTSSAVVEQKEVLYPSSQSRVEWATLEEEEGQAAEEGHEAPRPVTVHFVLEESSGYMEPTLRILAIMHTVISFFCIIGYYCLKVGSALVFLRQGTLERGIDGDDSSALLEIS